MRKTRPLLLVEDDSVDAMTIKRALDDIGSIDSMVHLTNGEQALDFLRSKANDLPSLILLDLNMPKMNGQEFLEEVRQDPTLCSIPIVVITTSEEKTDIQETFARSVAGYMVKPINYDRFVTMIETISQYWAINVLPVQ
jgi:CheY-like chemotaxis protein